MRDFVGGNNFEANEDDCGETAACAASLAKQLLASIKLTSTAKLIMVIVVRWFPVEDTVK